eukprot:Gb_00221 [translate_table: standard]
MFSSGRAAQESEEEMASPPRQNGVRDDDDEEFLVDQMLQEAERIFLAQGHEVNHDFREAGRMFLTRARAAVTYDLSAVLQASEIGDVDMLRRALENLHCSIDRTDEDGDTALHLACRHGNGVCAQVKLQFVIIRSFWKGEQAWIPWMTMERSLSMMHVQERRKEPANTKEDKNRSPAALTREVVNANTAILPGKHQKVEVAARLLVQGGRDGPQNVDQQTDAPRLPPYCLGSQGKIQSESKMNPTLGPPPKKVQIQSPQLQTPQRHPTAPRSFQNWEKRGRTTIRNSTKKEVAQEPNTLEGAKAKGKGSQKNKSLRLRHNASFTSLRSNAKTQKRPSITSAG